MAVKVFLTSSGEANVVCPECKKEKLADMSRFTNLKKEVHLNATCSCGHAFKITLERRRHPRKTVDLPGWMLFKKGRAKIRVLDISRYGMRIQTRTEANYGIEPGEEIQVKFTLDNAENALVVKDVEVRSVHQGVMGVKFLSEEHFDSFGAYIFFAI